MSIFSESEAGFRIHGAKSVYKLKTGKTEDHQLYWEQAEARVLVCTCYACHQIQNAHIA